LGLRGSLEGLRFTRQQPPMGRHGRATPLRSLRFHQTVGGRRVLWSKIDVAVTPGRVHSITATTVPVTTTKLGGTRRVTRARAVRIARRVVAGPEHALPAQPIAYAGSPVRPRRPQLGYVVQLSPTRFQPHDYQDLAESLCVVIDAQTGKVLSTYKGVAAQPDGGQRRVQPRADATVQAQTRLHYVFDAAGQPNTTGPLVYALSTVGDPLRWGTDGNVLRPLFPRGSPLENSLDRLATNLLPLGRHMCVARRFCGGYGAFHGQPVSPLQVVGRATFTRYVIGQHLVYMAPAESPADDILAHEFGHLMDLTYADDRIISNQGDEVQEGLADMFAYDYDRADATLGEDAPPRRQDFANPGAVLNPTEGRAYPARMLSYKCGATDEHFNSTILSHAYYRFVTKVGHGTAGHILQYIPWFLPARPRFIDVQRGFAQRAGELYGASVKQAAVDAFVNEVGIGRDDPPGC
jgi:Zn-dependent metalloprotease